MRKRVYQPHEGVRPSQVQQSAAKAADIKNIVSMHMKGPGRHGQPIGDPNATRQPRYMHVPSASYHEMLNQVTDIQSDFMTLPSSIRRKFNHNPYQLLRFLEVPENRSKALDMGLLVPTDEEYEKMLAEQARKRREEREDGSQLDLEDEAHKAGEEARKADPEANPVPPKKGAKNAR